VWKWVVFRILDDKFDRPVAISHKPPPTFPHALNVDNKPCPYSESSDPQYLAYAPVPYSHHQYTTILSVLFHYQYQKQDSDFPTPFSLCLRSTLPPPSTGATTRSKQEVNPASWASCTLGPTSCGLLWFYSYVCHTLVWCRPWQIIDTGGRLFGRSCVVLCGFCFVGGMHFLLFDWFEWA